MGIAGKEGSGKSHCALHIASRLYLSQMCSVVYLGCKTLQSSLQTTLVSILQEIQRPFEEAKCRQPSVLILDAHCLHVPTPVTATLSWEFLPSQHTQFIQQINIHAAAAEEAQNSRRLLS